MHSYICIISEGDCKTVGGPSVGSNCKFPFIYHTWDDIPYVPLTLIRWFSTEKKFESCTNNEYKKDGARWCATKVTSNNRYIPGHWGECPATAVCDTVHGSVFYL